ncbi:MAG: hypothetical protein CL573_04610 [Alphaproteobacteria bacterium]|nr:hypothetical protein [Alphaproteobacteria bacterium]HCP00709.1 hypothetical protein [Rhodospirillaceae bacterium]
MKVDQRKKVSSFQADFKKEFGVGIRVYKGVKLADDVALKSLTEKGSKGGAIDFGGNTKVKNVEKIFKEEMGIKVQVENKKGGLADNDATLASLNR